MTSIGAAWESYRREVVPGDAPAVQVQECRRAFYAGAKATLGVLLVIGDDAVGEDDGVAIIEALHEESRAFMRDVLQGLA